MTKPNSYDTVARLCEMYLSEYGAYKAASKPPRSERAARIAVAGLDSLLVSMEKVITPIVFNRSLEAQIHGDEQDEPPVLHIHLEESHET